MFLDIQRPYGDTSSSAEIVNRFTNRFVKTQWPVSGRMPVAYYYPSSLELDSEKRASLHAKCVIVDNDVAFISSANFTEAAQEKNVEVGVLVRSSSLSGQITRHFDALVEKQLMVQLELGSTL